MSSIKIEDRVKLIDVFAWFGVTAYAMSVAVLGLCLPEIKLDFNVSDSTLGSLEAIRTLCVSFACLTLGLIAARFTKKQFLWISYLILSAGLLIMSETRGGITLIIAVSLMGYGAGLATSVMNLLPFDAHPSSPNKYMGYISSCFPLGLVVSSIIFGYLLNDGFAWQTIPKLVAVVNIFAAFLTLIIKFPTNLDVSQEKTLSLFSKVFRLKIFWLFALATFIAGGMEAIFVFWSRIYLDTYFDVSARLSSFSITIFAIFMGLGRFFLSTLTDNFKTSDVLMMVAALGVVAGIIMPFTNSLILFYILVAVFGFCVSFLWPLALLEGAKYIPLKKSVVVSMLTLVGMLGLSFFPLLVGIISDYSSLRLAMITASVSYFVLLLIAFVLKKYVEK